MTDSHGLPILIAGGGIAGLAAALALARDGHPVQVFEQRDGASEDGAGIQLGSNAVKALRALGVAPQVLASATHPELIEVMSAVNGAVITALPLGPDTEQRWGAPYVTLARADLHAALRDAAMKDGLIEIASGTRIEALSEISVSPVRVSTTSGMVTGAALIGADGLWSTVRHCLFPGDRARPTGMTAYRATIPAPGDTAVIRLWLGSDAHLVHYPIANGRFMNVVAIVREEPSTEAYDQGADASALAERFRRWPEPVRDLLKSVETWRKWPLYEREATLPWALDRAVLIGDAAHPVLPFLAQGAALALEDAVALAQALRHTTNIAAGFLAFETTRRPRCRRVQTASRRNGGLYHFGGAAAVLRNAALRAVGGRVILGRFDWLYGAEVGPL